MGLLQDAYDDILKLRVEVGKFTIDVLEVLDALREYEVKNLRGYSNVKLYLDYLIDMGFIENEFDKSDNSYNWNSNISNHFNYYSYNANDGTVYIEFKVHRYGDVRGNYTETFLLNFDTFDDFLHVLHDVQLFESIEINDNVYDLHSTVFDEGLGVSDADGCYIMTTYENERESIIQDVLSELE